MFSLRSRIALVVLAAHTAVLAAGAALTRAPLYLDAGPVVTGRAGSQVLTPADAYEAGRGYGWTKAPADTFSHPQFDGVRSAALVDGVSGPDYTLRVDLAPGRWTVLAFLDDGYSNAHTVTLEANGQRIAHNPRAFGVDSEPEQPPINRYRVAEFTATVDGRLDLHFQQNAAGGTRLLALQFLPMDWPENDVTRWLRGQVEDAGRHDFHASLDILRAELGRRGRNPNEAAVCAYWKAQLDLLGEAEHWHQAQGWDEVTAQTRASMFVRYKIAVALLDPLVEHPDGDAFPLRDRARWLRARLLYWLWAEQHFDADLAAFQGDIAVLKKKYPHDSLIAMYAGEKIPDDNTRIAFTPQPGAPTWSTAQYEALQRLRDTAYYWIDERQIPNGEFGGKTDDDVELLRWWPVLMLSGDTKMRDSFSKLAEGVWFSPRMHEGFSKVARDVEHSSEFVSDTVPMMAFITRDPKWIARLAYSYRYMRDLWTGRNTHGDLLFKSAWLGATEVLMEAPRNRDLSMNARAAKAVRYYAWLTGDAEATQLLHDWSLSWSKAAAGTDKGKPRGLFPASLRWPDAVVNGDEPTWYHANMFWDYFNWRGDGRLYDQLLFSWLGDHDERLVTPMIETLALLEKYSKSAPVAHAAEGSTEWAAARLQGSSEFWNIVAQWRLESGDKRFDSFLAKNGPPYLRYRLTGDTKGLSEGIESGLLSVLRFNRPMRTQEVLFTDRVYVSEEDGRDEGADLLAAMLTGGHSAQGLSPYYQVAWENTPQTFTALVTDSGAGNLTADIFLHQQQNAGITARFFRLSPGSYRLIVTDGPRTLVNRTETVTGSDHRVALDLPGARVVTMKIARIATP